MTWTSESWGMLIFGLAMFALGAWFLWIGRPE